MWNFLVDNLSKIYVQVIILVLFVWYFFAHRRDPHLMVSRVSLVRIVFLVLAFIFFLLVWNTTLRPGLAATSVFGMFLINLSMLNSLVLARLEAPYRDALGAYCREPQNLEALEAIWKTGKRFYYLRNFLASLTSGVFPTRFLHEMATSRIRDDVQDCLRSHGFTQQFISLKGLLAHLEKRLLQEEGLPPEFKEMIIGDMEKLGSHGWVEEQVNEYLRMAMESPEKIHNPEWSRKWEETQTPSKS